MCDRLLDVLFSCFNGCGRKIVPSGSAVVEIRDYFGYVSFCSRVTIKGFQDSLLYIMHWRYIMKPLATFVLSVVSLLMTRNSELVVLFLYQVMTILIISQVFRIYFPSFSHVRSMFLYHSCTVAWYRCTTLVLFCGHRRSPPLLERN